LPAAGDAARRLGGEGEGEGTGRDETRARGKNTRGTAAADTAVPYGGEVVRGNRRAGEAVRHRGNQQGGAVQAHAEQQGVAEMAEPERVPPSRADGGETRVAERQGRYSCGRQRGREVRGAETMLHAALQPRSVHAGGAGIPCHGHRHRGAAVQLHGHQKRRHSRRGPRVRGRVKSSLKFSGWRAA